MTIGDTTDNPTAGMIEPADQLAAPERDDGVSSQPLEFSDLEMFAEEVASYVTRKISEVSSNVKIDALETKVDTLLTILTKADAILAALGKLTEAMTAPKTIITDATGKPVGIKVA
jgi:hypothetical protein